jgi:hypothetical protein
VSLKSKFGTVKNAETEGAWVDVMQNEDGSMCRVKLRRSGRRNKDYTKSFDKHTKPYRRILDNLDPEIDAKVMRSVIVDSIITEWENVQLEEGVNLPFNTANVENVLSELPDLQDFVLRKAGEIETFQEQALEAEAKN